MGENSFGAASSFEVKGEKYAIHRLDALSSYGADTLPYSFKILLENLLRHEDGVNVTAEDITALAGSATKSIDGNEIAFSPARILLQDYTGIPCIVDLAAMRDAIERLGGSPDKVNPQIPVDLVIDHSVVVDVARRQDTLAVNARMEFDRNVERYGLLRWSQQAFNDLRVLPPGAGICHQINLEYLSQVVFVDKANNAYPDSVVGADSHTPMVNGLGILAWGAGGIEAEAAMLGQPISMSVPHVVGLRLDGELPEGTTATDLVLTIAELLRSHGVVGKFVECYGPGVANVPLENRATIGNMSPEYGSTVTIFPIDEVTLRYLALTGRRTDLVEAYTKEQGLWHDPHAEANYAERIALDLSSVVPSISGPSRPQDRVPLSAAKQMFVGALERSLPDAGDAAVTKRREKRVAVTAESGQFTLDHGHVVIAAITSCTNTSNPQVMLAAGLLAKRAVEAGLAVKPWVKTSLAPGSLVVMDYYERAGLVPYLEKLGFGVVGFGCTTCIGNSGPLDAAISKAINDEGLACVAVLSGNRNFEGRIHPDVRMNYLASPPLVVAYALAGTMDIDLVNEPLGVGSDGKDVYLRDIWPTSSDVSEVVAASVDSEMFRQDYANITTGDERWRALDIPTGTRYAWSESTYVANPPYFEGMGPDPAPITDIIGARVLAILGDSVTTDHISPAGSIRPASPAGAWLIEHGVSSDQFNSYGTRRGNHEVMIRGTFANTRIRNRLAGGQEGGVTIHLPDREPGTIFDVAMRYQSEATPLILFAGKEYGSGSSRDWAAKGPYLLGVRAAIAESYERIHRSNLIGMGIAPLEFLPGENVDSLGLTGEELYGLSGFAGVAAHDLIRRRITITAGDKIFEAILRIDTPTEADYFVNGGILQYVVRMLAKEH